MNHGAGLDEADSAAGAPVRLLALAHRLLENRLEPPLSAFLDAWPQPAEIRRVVPDTVPAVRWLPQLAGSAPGFSVSFAAALVSAAPALVWRRSYSARTVGNTFFDSYGWSELAGLTGPTPSGRLACGVLILGPEILYPPHRHEAEEIYLPLAGVAEWRQGGGRWRARAPGSVIHHASGESHAMRTGREPLLALYLWRSDVLDQKARLD